MEHRVLGASGLRVSTLGLGTMVLGPWGTTDDDECHRVIHAALDAGIDHVDTADVYGEGVTEEIVGRALGSRRDDVVLASKCYGSMGPGANDRGGSRRWVRRAVEASLRRLGTDRLDICYLHRHDPDTDLDETLGALSDLVHEGKVLAWGTSTFPAESIVEAVWCAERRRHVRPTVEQPPYSVLARGIERAVLPTCERHRLGVAVWSPLSGGWLTGKYRTGVPDQSRAVRNPDHFDHGGPAHDAKATAVDRLAALADGAGLPLAHLAIAWTLAHPAVSSSLIGVRTVDQLDQLVGAAEVSLGDDLLDAVDEVVAPGVDVNPADSGWVPPSLEASARRR